MKTILKLFTVLFLVLVLTTSGLAQINWLKYYGPNYLGWDNGKLSKTITDGESATLTTGYFGSTAGSTVLLTVNLNDQTTGKLVKTLVDSKVVKVDKELGYEEVTIGSQDYQKPGKYLVVIKLKD